MATNNNIDKLFRDKLSNYELESPQNVWNNIMLQQANKPLWKLSYSIVLLLVFALSGLSALYISTENTEANNIMSQNQRKFVVKSFEEKPDVNEKIKTINYQNSSFINENTVTPETKLVNIKNTNTPKISNGKDNLSTFINKNIYENKNLQNNDDNNITKDNLTINNSAKTTKNADKNNDYEVFNKNLSRDKSIPSLVLVLDKDKTDGTEEGNNIQKTNVQYKPSPWSFEVGLRTAFASSTYNNTSDDWNKQVEARKQSEKFLPSFGINLKANYSLNKKIGITSGISFLNLKQKLNFEYSNTEMIIQEKTKQGYILNPDGSTTPYTYNYMDTSYNNINTSRQNTNNINMIDIPLILDVKLFAMKGFSLSIQPGVMANIYMKKQGYEINKNADNTEVTNDNNYKINAGINYRLGLSAEWILTKNASIVVQPYYLKNAKGLNGNNYPVNYKINQISTDIGIRFQLP